MKKYLIASLLVFLSIVFVACGIKDLSAITVTTSTASSTETTQASTTSAASSMEEIPSTTKKPDFGEYPGIGKHEGIYYLVAGTMVDIVCTDVYKQWAKTAYFDDFNEMAIVQFIKQFNITREQFNKANEAREKSYLDDGYKWDEFEHYNADIIYTFDNDLISEYYKVKE